MKHLINLLENYPHTERGIKECGEEKTEAEHRVARQFGREFFSGKRLHDGLEFNSQYSHHRRSVDRLFGPYWKHRRLLLVHALDKETKFRVSKRMSITRYPVETVAKRYSEQEIRCSTHLPIGQEAIPQQLMKSLSRAITRSAHTAFWVMSTMHCLTYWQARYSDL